MFQQIQYLCTIFKNCKTTLITTIALLQELSSLFREWLLPVIRRSEMIQMECMPFNMFFMETHLKLLLTAQDYHLLAYEVMDIMNSFFF
jgi:hypothetical protein